VTPPSTGTPPAAPPDERTAAPEATDQVGHKPSGSTQSPPSPAREASDDSDRPRTRRFARDSGDASGTPASGDRSSDAAQPPIGRYDSLTATEIVARLRSLSQGELATLERYEQRHDGRQTILSRIASLREDEPWRGYDDATVPEIRRALAEADEERAKRVRDYERRHRDRKGVMEAARRAVAAA
jgi:hypothetical protein